MYTKHSRTLWLVIGAAFGGMAEGRVVTDGTVGPALGLTGPNYAIAAELGQRSGSNLFHSFQEFSLADAEQATFSGPADITNIIGRVTGGQASIIDGLLRSEIAGANLFLMNPAGIGVTQNAKLEISGALHFSTADYLVLGAGDGRFDARTPAASVLSSAPPSAFGFVSQAPAPLSFTGALLQLAPQQTLSLIGGDITLHNATLYAPGGRANVASVADAGEVVLTQDGVDVSDFDALGRLSVSQDVAFRTLDGTDATRIVNIDTSGDGEVATYIRAGHFELSGGQIFADTRGNADAQGVDIALRGNLTLSANRETALVTANVIPAATGGGGDIRLAVDGDIELRGGLVSSATFGPGHGGDVMVSAGTVTVSEGSSIGAQATGAGDGGDVLIDAGRVRLETGGTLSTDAAAAGRGGTVRIIADDLELASDARIRAQISGTGAGAGADLQVTRLSIEGGARITTISRGPAAGGDVVIQATESVAIAGRSALRAAVPSGIETSTSSTGSAGDIRITTARFELRDGASIQARTSRGGAAGSIVIDSDALGLSGGASLDTETTGPAAGGDIRLDVLGTAHLTGADTRISGRTVNAPGAGGAIRITAERLQLEDGATVTASSRGGTSDNGDADAANAGRITIAANTLELRDGAAINAEAQLAGGGQIDLRGTGRVLLRDSEITTQVRRGADDAGDITIERPQAVALAGSRIIANAEEGNGGNIRIVTDTFVQTPDSIVDASSNTGIDGIIDIQAPDTDISGQLAGLPENYLDITALLADRCAARRGDTPQSSLVLAGRGGMPAAPAQVAHAGSHGGWPVRQRRPAQALPGPESPLALVRPPPCR